MRYNLKNEWPVLIIMAAPLVYLLSIWNTLPDIVPVHWSVQGKADRFGKKENLLLIPFLLPLLTYSIFSVAPRIDPKGKLKNMGDKLSLMPANNWNQIKIVLPYSWGYCWQYWATFFQH